MPSITHINLLRGLVNGQIVQDAKGIDCQLNVSMVHKLFISNVSIMIVSKLRKHIIYLSFPLQSVVENIDDRVKGN